MRFVLPCLVLLAVLTACGSDESKRSGAPEKGPDAAAVKAVEGAYLGYWDVVLAGIKAPGRKHDLEARMTGDELERFDDFLMDLATDERRMKGRFGHRVEVREVEGDRAVVHDCLRAYVRDASQKKPTWPEGEDWGVGTRATLTRVDGEWKVAQVADDPKACTPVRPGGAPSPSGGTRGDAEEGR